MTAPYYDIRTTVPGYSTHPVILKGSAAPVLAPVKVGDVYIDETLAEPYISVGTSVAANWLNMKPHYDPTFVYGYDDFEGYYDTALWTKGGVGTPDVSVLTSGVGGQLRMTTSGAQNDSTQIWMASKPMKVADGLLVEARVNLAQITTTEFQFGISDSLDIDDGSGNSVFFEYNSTNTDPTYWHTNTDIAGTVADNGKTIPGVVAALGTWVKLGIFVGVVAPSVNPKVVMYINDVAVDDITMPDPVYECSPAFNIKTLAVATKSVDIDYCGWRIPRTQNA